MIPTINPAFPGRLAIQQRVLTPYRATFFDTLASSCKGGLSVCAGLPLPEQSIAHTQELHVAQYIPADNLHILHGSLYLCYQRNLLNWLEEWDPDVLILEANQRYLSTPAAVRWMKKRKRPVLGWGLGQPRASGRSFSLGQTSQRPFLSQFDAMLTYSAQGFQEYAALGFPEDRIFIAPNAVAGRPTAPPPRRNSSFSGQPNVLFVGRLQKRKRVDLLLRACACLPKGLQPKVVIVGDGPERKALKALARSVYPKAEFTGMKQGDELSRCYREADLFVLPGTGGLAVQEAMSHALPIIMGKGDGTNEDLVRTGNGWHFSGEDVNSLSELLREALGNADRLRAMGKESYRIVAEEINLEKMVQAFLLAINQVERG